MFNRGYRKLNAYDNEDRQPLLGGQKRHSQQKNERQVLINDPASFATAAEPLEEQCKKHYADRKKSHGGLLRSPIPGKKTEYKSRTELKADFSRLQMRANDLYTKASTVWKDDYYVDARVWIQRLRYEKYGIRVPAYSSSIEDISRLPRSRNQLEVGRRRFLLAVFHAWIPGKAESFAENSKWDVKHYDGLWKGFRLKEIKWAGDTMRMELQLYWRILAHRQLSDNSMDSARCQTRWSKLWTR